MARVVAWSETAVDDLESAARFIERDSPAYASAFAREILEAADSLSEFAERGQIVPEFMDPALRELLVRPYRILYRVRPDTVVILAVIHGRRRAQRL